MKRKVAIFRIASIGIDVVGTELSEACEGHKRISEYVEVDFPERDAIDAEIEGLEGKLNELKKRREELDKCKKLTTYLLRHNK